MTKAPGVDRFDRLDEALELVATLVQDPTDAVVAFDRELRIRYWSAAMTRRWQLEPARALGQDLIATVPLFAVPDELDNLRATLAGGAPRSRGRAVAESSFDVTYAPLAAAGEIYGGAAVIRDVTARGISEAQLLETERRFQNMADAAPVMLWMSRADSLCTFFNQTWLSFTGRSLEQEWGVGWAEGVHYEDLQHCLDSYVDAFNARRVFEIEYRLRRADGEYRWVLDRGTPRHTADGTFAGFIGSCIDITERREIEHQLRQALAVKDEFLGLISHELRTPITTLYLLLERMRDEAATLQPRLLDRMDVALARLTQMIESVLQFSRIESGRLRVNALEMDLAPLIAVIADELRPSAERKNLALTSHVEIAVPPITSDPELVRLIVSNLVTNAIKFTDAGSVAIAASYGRDGHRIDVIDTGRGIALAQQARIFEPFEQLEPGRQKHTPGVGLGLALVKAMTAALGGQISVRSAPSQGSTFTLVFPPGPGSAAWCQP